MDRAPAVNGDWSVVSELVPGLVNLTNQLHERLAGARYSCTGRWSICPVSELELTNGPPLAVLHTMQQL